MNSIETQRKRCKLSNLYTALVILLPITSVYAVPFIPAAISLGELLIIFLIPLMLVNQADKVVRIALGNPLWTYLIYAFIATMMASFSLFLIASNYSMTNMIFRVVRDFFYFLMILFWGKEFFDFSVGIKLLVIIAKVASIFMIVQFISYQFLNLSISGFIPNMRTTISGGVLSDELVGHFLKSASYDGYLRVYGFFSEPAVAAQFLSAALLVLFFLPSKNRIDFKWTIILSIAIVLTFSVNGYVALVLCWGIMFIKAKKSRLTKEVCVTIGVVLIMLLPIVLSNDNISGVFLRLVTLFKGENTQNSAALRVLRGPAFFMNMPLVYQIFGSGFGNFEDFKAAFEINTVYEMATEYLNTNAYIAISSGAIGFFLYVRGIWLNTARKPFFAKAVALLVFLLGCACSIYSSSIYVIYLLLIINCPLEESRNDKYNNIT